MAGDYTSINLHSLLRRSVHVHKICKNVGSLILGIHIQTTVHISGDRLYLPIHTDCASNRSPNINRFLPPIYSKGMHVRIFSIRAIHAVKNNTR